MTDTPIKATRWHLFWGLGARRLPQTGPHIVIECPEGPVLFWPVDRKLVEEVAS